MNASRTAVHKQKRPSGLIGIGLPALFLIAIGAQAQTAEPALPYVVKASDNVIGIAKRHLVDPRQWSAVARFNAMPDPNVIRPGQTVRIPLRLMKFQPVAGRLVAAQGDVRLGGAAAAVGAAVNEGTRLETGANSSAVVELADGSRVKLLPTSLAEVVNQREYALRDAAVSGSSTWFSGLVRLAQGTVETLASATTRRARPLSIETPTSLVGVRGTEFRVAYDDPASRNARTEVLAGLVRADNPAQQSGAEVARGEGAVINPAQREVRVVKLLPAPELGALPGEVLKPAGAWPLPVLAGASAYRVQVAADAQFNGIVRDPKATGGTVNLASLPDGTWNARVRGIDAAGLEGLDAVRQIVLRTVLPSRWRATGGLLRHQGGQTELRWTPQSPEGGPLTASRYTLELATDAGFTRDVRRAESTEARAALGELASGTWYLRLKATTPDGRTLDSDAYRFEVPSNWGQTVFDSAVTLDPLPPR